MDFTKLKHLFIFEQVQEKKTWTNWQRKYFLPQKIVIKLSEIWVGEPGMRDPGPGKNIPDSGSGSRGQKSTGSWIQIRNTSQTP